MSNDFVVEFALFRLQHSLELSEAFVQNAALLVGGALLAVHLLASPDPFSRLLHFHGDVPFDALLPGPYVVAPDSVVHDVVCEVDLAVVLQVVEELRRIEDGRQELVVNLLLVNEKGQQEPNHVRQQLQTIKVVNPFGGFDILEDFRHRFPDPGVVQNMHDLPSFLHSDGFGLIDHLTQFVEHQLVVITEILLSIQYLKVGSSFILLCSRAMFNFDLMLVSKLLLRSHMLLLVSSKGFVIRIAFADHAHIARICLWRFLFHSEVHRFVELLKYFLCRIWNVTLVIVYENLSVSFGFDY